jgi:hypothetical protein
VSDLRYRDEATFRVVVEGAGQHADGDGATATFRRIEEAIEDDPRVIEGQPGFPRYIGRNA